MPNRTPPSRTRWPKVAAGVVAFGLLVAAWTALAQTTAPVTPSNVIAAPAAAAKGTAVKATAPAWTDLRADQQTALKPLAANWPNMSSGHKSKWLEVSKNYASIAPAEQAKLHARMSDWASLSPQQRAQARINFAENQALTSGLTPEQRKVQWQAYQLLSPEEKRKLAASSGKTTVGSATTPKPTDLLKNSPPPEFGTAKVLDSQNKHPTARKIAVAPHLQKSNSLMPQTSSTVSAIDPSGQPATATTTTTR
jgi:Protein of unknown function (DUF3106)